jgi:hypothetical protein
MPVIQPSRADVHVNRPLTNISIAFLQRAENFVADRVFPNIPVTKQSDRYFTYDRGEFNRDEMELRAPGTESAGGTYTIDNTPTYFAETRAFHKDIPDPIRANADTPLSPDREATEYLTHKALINREVNWAAAYFATGVWTVDLTGVAAAPGANQFLQWNDAASTPIEDIRTAKRNILESTGFMPNKLVLGRPVFDTLVDHPDIVARLDRGQTPVGPALATRDRLAAIFEVDEVLVMDAIQNTAAKGATNVHAFIGGNAALLTYAAPSPGLMTPSGGYTFSWTGLLGASASGMRVKRFRIEALESDRVEIENSYDQALIAAGRVRSRPGDRDCCPSRFRSPVTVRGNMMAEKRRVRHWKQRFNPAAAFVWARHLVFEGKAKKPGQKVTKSKISRNKLARLWYARFIEEASWKPPVVHNPLKQVDGEVASLSDGA